MILSRSGNSHAVATGQRRVDDGHGLVAHVGPAGRVTQIEVGIEQGPQPQMFGATWPGRSARRRPPGAHRRSSPPRRPNSAMIVSKRCLPLGDSLGSQPQVSLAAEALFCEGPHQPTGQWIRPGSSTFSSWVARGPTPPSRLGAPPSRCSESSHAGSLRRRSSS